MIKMVAFMQLGLWMKLYQPQETRHHLRTVQTSVSWSKMLRQSIFSTKIVKLVQRIEVHFWTKTEWECSSVILVILDFRLVWARTAVRCIKNVCSGSGCRENHGIWIQYPGDPDYIQKAMNLWQRKFNYSCAVGGLEITPPS